MTRLINDLIYIFRNGLRAQSQLCIWSSLSRWSNSSPSEHAPICVSVHKKHFTERLDRLLIKCINIMLLDKTKRLKPYFTSQTDVHCTSHIKIITALTISEFLETLKWWSTVYLWVVWFLIYKWQYRKGPDDTIMSGFIITISFSSLHRIKSWGVGQLYTPLTPLKTKKALRASVKPWWPLLWVGTPKWEPRV